MMRYYVLVTKSYLLGLYWSAKSQTTFLSNVPLPRQNNTPFNITSCFVTAEDDTSAGAKDGDDSSDDDSDDEDFEAGEETTLEAYTTPLDEEATTVDEYGVFKQVLYSK